MFIRLFASTVSLRAWRASADPAGLRRAAVSTWHRSGAAPLAQPPPLAVAAAMAHPRQPRGRGYMSADLRSRSSRSVPLLKAGLIWPRVDHVPAMPVSVPAWSGPAVWPTLRGRLARSWRQPSPSKRLISRSQAWAAVACAADAYRC